MRSDRSGEAQGICWVTATRLGRRAFAVEIDTLKALVDRYQTQQQRG